MLRARTVAMSGQVEITGFNAAYSVRCDCLV